jgi:diguanylate cyclase (GGDEF)-like protein/hemerythrin-like metal-binding protein
MESFKWGKQFFTNIPEIDNQHQSLVTLINEYGNALSENNINGQVLESIFKRLISYTKTHFTTEEKLMDEMNLDQRHIETHFKCHHDFVQDITEFSRTTNMTSQEDCLALFNYLAHWIAYHVLGSDLVMARQISSIEDGKKPQEALDEVEQSENESTATLLAALKGLLTLLSQRNKALTELNRTLESRVAERTKDLAQANEALEVISITDHLTDLPNRRFAMRQLQLLWAESVATDMPLACLMIDADGFKSINDGYGHAAGDRVLQRLSIELLHSVHSDDIVCRLGGDEFLVICPQTSLKGALHIAEQTRTKVSALKVFAGSGFWYGSVSIGVAVRDDTMKKADDLLRAADKAVYIAKNDGKNCVRALVEEVS